MGPFRAPPSHVTCGKRARISREPRCRPACRCVSERCFPRPHPIQFDSPEPCQRVRRPPPLPLLAALPPFPARRRGRDGEARGSRQAGRGGGDRRRRRHPPSSRTSPPADLGAGNPLSSPRPPRTVPDPVPFTGCSADQAGGGGSSIRLVHRGAGAGLLLLTHFVRLHRARCRAGWGFRRAGRVVGDGAQRRGVRCGVEEGAAGVRWALLLLPFVAPPLQAARQALQEDHRRHFPLSTGSQFLSSVTSVWVS